MKRVALLLIVILTALLISSCSTQIEKNTATDVTGEVTTTEELDVHVHSYGEWKVIKEATCVEIGIKERACSCGEKEKETIPAKGHTEVVDSAVEATCTRSGKTEGSHCSVCNAIIIAQETIAPKEHNYSDWVIVKSAKCEEAGLKECTCAICGYKASEVIPAIGHSYVDGICAVCHEKKPSEGLSIPGLLQLCKGNRNRVMY